MQKDNKNHIKYNLKRKVKDKKRENKIIYLEQIFPKKETTQTCSKNTSSKNKRVSNTKDKVKYGKNKINNNYL